MSIVVPFDGTALSKAALERASELGSALEEDVVALTVVPKSNVRYAREREWLDENQHFDTERVLARVEDQVSDVAPETEFEYELVSRYAQAGEIASKIRAKARKLDATLVVLGSDDAGRIVTRVSSVGSPVAADEAYDVMLVRQNPTV